MDTSFPVSIIVSLLVLIIFLVFWGMVFIILYHLTRFGVGTQPKRLSAAFFLGAIIIFGASILLFANLDLNAMLS